MWEDKVFAGIYRVQPGGIDGVVGVIRHTVTHTS